MLPNQEESEISCPYCGSTITVLLDASSGCQEYYEDCSVCCAPILFSTTIDLDGNLDFIDVKRDDE